MTTDLTERGLERLICKGLTGDPCDPPSGRTVGEPPRGYGGVGWSPANHHDYNREYCVDLVQLGTFLHTTQPNTASALRLDEDCPTRRKFLARLQGEISKRGTIDVLRNGIKHGPHDLDLFFGTPSAQNEKAQRRFRQNRFTVTRQLRYSRDDTQRSLDIGLFINGLPVFTFELKNRLTKQTVSDAIWQYKKDRSPRERLFQFGRCVAHFAVDENEVHFCTHLKGKASWFLPFNRGWQGGAGNPPDPNGLRSEYLWREVLTRESLSNILENYAQVLASKNAKTGKTKKVQIWPRYQQLEVVRRLLADARKHGAGKRYLIQHSAGSGKSFSIAWLAHQLIPLEKDGAPVFDSIIVVTDRRILDKQIRDTIRQYAQVGSTVGHAERSGDLRRFIERGKKIIISTIQKFPFILDEIGNEQRGRTFAIIIDEAHSSQGGKTSGAMAEALGKAGEVAEEETYEDQVNRLMASRKLLSNASYYAFTATPKNKTLEIFGEPDPQGDGTVRHLPFHNYGMKQAIQEGFILDVLKHYTPVNSYYKLAKTVEGDPEFDVKKARKKLRRFVEGHEHAIRLKAEIMVDHFHEQVVAQHKIDGKARAMVVTNGVARAIQYFHAIRDYLKERKSPYQAIVGLLGRARLRWGDGERGIAERVPLGQDRREVPGGPVPLPRLRGQVPDGVRRTVAPHHVRRQDPLGDQGGPDPVTAQSGAPEETRCLRARLPERHGHHHRSLLELLPNHDPGRRDRPEQSPRPAGRIGRRPGVLARSGHGVCEAVSGGSGAGPARPHPGPLCGGVHERTGRRRAGCVQEQGQGVRTHLRLPLLHPPLQQPGLGGAFDLPELSDRKAAVARGGGPVEGNPRDDRHGQLPGREEEDAEDHAGG